MSADQDDGAEPEAQPGGATTALPSNVVRLPNAKARRKLKARNVTLCRHGHHKWAVVDTPFDVFAGRLIPRLRCARCGEERTEAR